MTLVATQPASYTEIFNLRGTAYHAAMSDYPLARQAELATAIAYADIQADQVVIDIPSGGGYLAEYCPPQTQLICVDTSAQFISSAYQKPNLLAVQCENMAQLSLDDETADRIVSLAGVHHEANRINLYREWFRLLKPNGKLSLADVWTGTPTGVYLNGFVDTFNPMGHQGDFLTAQDLADLEAVGFVIPKAQLERVSWQFTSLAEMESFIGRLFYLENCPNTQTFVDGINGCFEMNLDLNANAATPIALPWELFYIQAVKPST